MTLPTAEKTPTISFTLLVWY